MLKSRFRKTQNSLCQNPVWITLNKFTIESITAFDDEGEIMQENTCITAMVVEDEYLLLEDFVALVDWESIGVRIVATALNGTQGITKFEEHKPQLVFTDIKMPDISGLDMIKSIRYQYPDLKTSFVIITAYSDFEFAKQAIRMGVSDYVLKSEISEEYISGKIAGIVANIRDREKTSQTVLKNDISDIILSKEPPEYDELHELLMAISSAWSEQTFLEFVDFIRERMLEQYKNHHIEQKFFMPELHNTEELCRWLWQDLHTLQTILEQIYQEKYSPTVLKAMEYIDKNYANPDLMLIDIAESVNVSVSRLCVLFKKELNQTVGEVLTKKRIEEAKKLLYLDNLKVYEVSERVGYRTSQYFSKIFYQQTGQNPNSCRRPQLPE